jgi:hypothetical protein
MAGLTELVSGASGSYDVFATILTDFKITTA